MTKKEFDGIIDQGRVKVIIKEKKDGETMFFAKPKNLDTVTLISERTNRFYGYIRTRQTIGATDLWIVRRSLQVASCHREKASLNQKASTLPCCL